MIANLIIAVFTNLLQGVISLFPEPESLPDWFNNGANYFGNAINFIHGIFPLTTNFFLVAMVWVLVVDGAILVYKLINRALNLLRGSGN